MRVHIDNLQKVIAGLLGTAGVSGDEADAVVRILSEADLKGISTHGIYFLPMLLERIKSGLVVAPTKITVLNDEGATLHLDGGNGIGQIAAEKAMKGAMEKAGKYGIGVCLLRNTNHIGLLAHYSLMAAGKGMIGFCSSNSASAMAPWGGAEQLFGTNPFSIAAPGGRGYPIVLDMSTTLVARGKIRKAARLGEKIPDGWALDAKGNPTNDPDAAMKGSLLPVGGPKGYGLALFVDLISGLISGSSYSKNVKTFHQPLGPTGVGMAAVAIDISKFMPEKTYIPLVEEYILSIKNSPRADGVARIYMPGEIELDREEESRKKGIELDSGVFSSINKLLEENRLKLKLEEV